jgi:hypothetical protein
MLKKESNPCICFGFTHQQEKQHFLTAMDECTDDVGNTT